MAKLTFFVYYRSHQLLLKELVKTVHHQQLDIEYQMKRISAHKLLIQDYHHKLFKLNQSLDVSK